MGRWCWELLPEMIRVGIRASTLSTLGVLSAWLHAQIRERRTYNDDSDLAQAICWELRRMMLTHAGRNRLALVYSMSGFLETLATRLHSNVLRAEMRYKAALARFAPVRHIPDPAEHLEELELQTMLIGGMSRLNQLARQGLRLRSEGIPPQEIAEHVWGKRAGKRGADRVNVILERARAHMRRFISPLMQSADRRATERTRCI